MNEGRGVIGVERQGKTGTVSAIIIGVVIAFGVIWSVFTGAKNLLFAEKHEMKEAFTNLQKGDLYEGNISAASKQCYEKKHTINYIPMGTEYYYLMYSEDMNGIILIRAPKKFDDSFTNDILNIVGKSYRGVVRELERDIAESMVGHYATLNEKGVHLETTLYIDLMSDRLSLMQIFVGISFLLCTIYIIVLGKHKGDGSVLFSHFMSTVVLIIFLATMVMILYLLNMVKLF